MCLFPGVWEFDQILLSFTVFEKHISTYSTEISMICRGKISQGLVTTECAWTSACLLEISEIQIKRWVLLAHFSPYHLINFLLISRKTVSVMSILSGISLYSPVNLVPETILRIALSMLGSVQSRLAAVWRGTGESQGLRSDQNWQVLYHSHWERWTFPPGLQSPPKIHYWGWCQGFMKSQLFRMQALRGRVWAVTFWH